MIQPLPSSMAASGGAVATAPPKLPILKELSCPNCAAPLKVTTASAQTLICANCKHHVAVGAGDAVSLGRGSVVPPSPVPIRLGMTLKLEGTDYFVMGRVMYRGSDDEDSWTWDEWLLGAADGRLLYLSYDREDGFVLFRKMKLTAPIEKRAIPLKDGTKAAINERYPARIIGAEGELTFRAGPGDSLVMIEGAARGKSYSVQQTSTELEAYEGETISSKQIAEALGDPTWAQKLSTRENSVGVQRSVGLISIVFAVLGFILFIGVNSSGVVIAQQSFVLNNIEGQKSAVLPINLDSLSQHQVRLKLLGGLATNSGAEVEVSIRDTREIEAYLFEADFWDEQGYDEGEFWRETNYNADGLFVPSERGAHSIELTLTAVTPNVTGVNVEATVLKNRIRPEPLLVYTGLAAIAGVVFIWAGSQRPK